MSGDSGGVDLASSLASLHEEGLRGDLRRVDLTLFALCLESEDCAAISGRGGVGHLSPALVRVSAVILLHTVV